MICIALIGGSLVIFALFDHVIPRIDKNTAYVPPTAQGPYTAQRMSSHANALTTVPADADISQPVEASADESPAQRADPEPDSTGEETVPHQAATGDFSQKFADKFTDGEIIITDTTYHSANLNITLSKMTGGFGDYDEVCFVEDIYIRNIDCLRTVLAKDRFGRSLTESVVSMSKRANAVCAINSDFYSFGGAGIVIRNGMLYRDEYQSGEEVLVIFRDGSMWVYSKEEQMDFEKLMADGAWQAFSFGPSLLDVNGELRSKYKDVNHDPRTIIGMVEPGHYMFIVVDGRQKGYSDGLTYEESAMLAKRLGCKVAFNLDGGKTTQMLFGGNVVNKPYKGGRSTSDLICIADITW